MERKVNLLLILPADAIHRAKTGIFKKSLRYAPLTLTYLASLVPDDLNINLKLLDEEVKSLESLDFEPDIVGISVMTAAAPRAYAIADYYRNKGIKVMLGGVHPTLLPKESLEHADSVVAGFAERALPQLLRDFSKSKMKRMYIDRGDLPLRNIPFPKRELIKKGSYISVNTIMATRGCPKNCSFCAVPYVWKKRYFMRPIEEVIKEIKSLEGEEVIFIDVHLLGDPDYACKLLQALSPLRKKWFGLTTAEALFDNELLSLVIQSGCKGLLIGFESVLPEVLHAVHKDSNIAARYGELIKILHDNGIRVNGTFLFGTDYDDKGVFEMTVEFVDRVDIDLPRYSVFTPYPGTPEFQKLEKEGRIIEYNWALYDVEHVVFKPKNMEPEELMEGLHWVWRETYTLRSIFKRISDTRSLYWIALLANLGYKYYAWKLPSCTKEVMCDTKLGLK